ncbi:hypothetical protein SFRURICE_021096 [Spodoptera frugiperda]|nr:hypothetical protein SFRURICE_021096 [Spodoptera frugiperda]
MLHVSLSSRSVGTRDDLHIILVYMPPDVSSIPDRLTYIGQALTDTMSVNSDFNLPCLTWSGDGYSVLNNCPLQIRTAAASFADEISVLGLSQHNLITNTNDRILDLCFSTTPLLVSKSDDPLLLEDSHHPALVITATEIFLTPLKEMYIPRRNYYKGDYEELNKYFNMIDWDDKLAVESVDTAVNVFYAEVKLGVERFIPLVKKPKNPKYPVWYSRALIKIIREKIKLHRKWKKYGNPRDYYEFALLRSRQHELEASSFKSYITHTEKAISHSPKTFWTYVKGRRGGSQYPKTMTLNEETYESGNEICTAFNKYFHSVFTSPSTSSVTATPDEVTGSDNVMSNLRHEAYDRDCRHYNMLSLVDRRKMLDMLLLFDILRGRVDSSELLSSIYFCTPKTRTRHTNLLSIPGHRTKYGRNAVMTRLPRIYSESFESIDIFHLPKPSFRKQVKKILFNE